MQPCQTSMGILYCLEWSVWYLALSACVGEVGWIGKDRWFKWGVPRAYDRVLGRGGEKEGEGSVLSFNFRSSSTIHLREQLEHQKGLDYFWLGQINE